MTIVLYETQLKTLKNGTKPYEIASIEIINKNSATITTLSAYDTNAVMNLIRFVIHGYLTQAVETGEEYIHKFSISSHEKNTLQFNIQGCLKSAFEILKKNSMSENLFNAACEAVNSLENQYKNESNISNNNIAQKYLNGNPSLSTSKVFFNFEEKNKNPDATGQAKKTAVIKNSK